MKQLLTLLTILLFTAPVLLLMSNFFSVDDYFMVIAYWITMSIGFTILESFLAWLETLDL